MKIKAAFIDLDGTLLHDNFSTSVKNVEAIRKAAESGIEVVPTTGRALGDMPRQITDIDGIKYLILANGAIVYDNINKKVIFDDYMDKRKVLALINSEGMREAAYFAMLNGVSHYQRSIFERVRGTRIYRQLDDFLRYDCVLTEDVYADILKSENSVEKIVFFFRDGAHMFSAINSTPQLLEFDAANSFEENIELTKKGVNKAHGVRFLCERLGFDSGEAAAIGDSGNDEQMLKYTQNSYAVENAMQSAKKAARRIVPSNIDNGVACFLRELMDINAGRR